MADIEYSKLTINAMFHRYNDEAARRGVPRMKKMQPDRASMCKALALLMAQPRSVKAAVPKKIGPEQTKAIIIEELCRIAYYEGDTGKRVEVKDVGTIGRKYLRSCGFAYADVLLAIKARLPHSKITGPKLRVHATNIRNRRPGYDGAKLPDLRKHSTKKG